MSERPALPPRPVSRQAFLRPVADWLHETRFESEAMSLGGQAGPEPRVEKPAEAPRPPPGTLPPAKGESASKVIRTAICFESRHGRLHVFMPPVDLLEDYLDLIAAIEDTAATLKIPVILEGDQPWRLHVSRRASRWPQSREAARELL